MRGVSVQRRRRAAVVGSGALAHETFAAEVYTEGSGGAGVAAFRSYFWKRVPAGINSSWIFSFKISRVPYSRSAICLPVGHIHFSFRHSDLLVDRCILPVPASCPDYAIYLSVHPHVPSVYRDSNLSFVSFRPVLLSYPFFCGSRLTLFSSVPFHFTPFPAQRVAPLNSAGQICILDSPFKS